VLDWSVTSGEVTAGLRLGGSLWWFWSLRGYLTEGRERLAMLLAVEEGSLPQLPAQDMRSARAKAQACIGFLALWQGDFAAAHSLFTESLATQREVGDHPSIAFSLTGLGQVSLGLGDVEGAQSLCEEALPVWRRIDDMAGVGWSLNILGNVAAARGEYDVARSLLEEGLAFWRESGDRWGIAWSLNDLGHVAFGQGDYGAAQLLYEESLGIKQELGDKAGIAWSLDNLGLVARCQADYGAARALYREGLALRRELGDRRGTAACLEGLAGAALEMAGRGGDPGMGASGREERSAAVHARRAARLLGAAHAIRQSLGASLSPHQQAELAKQLAQLRAALGKAAFSAAWEAGRAMSLEEATADGLTG
jgi:tetratricopeptide (TPR) repeat protein